MAGHMVGDMPAVEMDVDEHGQMRLHHLPPPREIRFPALDEVAYKDDSQVEHKPGDKDAAQGKVTVDVSGNGELNMRVHPPEEAAPAPAVEKAPEPEPERNMRVQDEPERNMRVHTD